VCYLLPVSAAEEPADLDAHHLSRSPNAADN
jgi:hypothetical protein